MTNYLEVTGHVIYVPTYIDRRNFTDEDSVTESPSRNTSSTDARC